MSIVRNQINTLSTIRNLAGLSVQIRNYTERKPNLRKPKDPDHNKKVLLSLIEPFYQKDKRTNSEKCIEWKKQRVYIPHPYVRLQAETCAKELKTDYIYLFHLNSLTKYYFNELRKDFLRKDIYLRNYITEVVKLAIEDSRLSNLYQFFRHHGCFAYSKENKLDQIEKLCKANNGIILMGAVIDNRILNLKQLQEYTMYGGIDTVRASLCNTLSTQTSQLSSTLSYHSNELAFNLTNHVENDSKMSVDKVKSSDDKNVEKS